MPEATRSMQTWRGARNPCSCVWYPNHWESLLFYNTENQTVLKTNTVNVFLLMFSFCPWVMQTSALICTLQTWEMSNRAALGGKKTTTTSCWSELRNTGREVGIHPLLDSSLSQGTIHTRIHTYRSFRTTNAPRSMVLGGGGKSGNLEETCGLIWSLNALSLT